MYDVRCPSVRVRTRDVGFIHTQKLYYRNDVWICTYAIIVPSERHIIILDMLECNIRNNCTVLGVWAMYIFANFYVDDCTIGKTIFANFYVDDCNIGTTYRFALLECNIRNNCTVLAVFCDVLYYISFTIRIYFCYMCMLIFAITPKNNHICMYWNNCIYYL